jgi:hypothetical protein
MLNDGPCRGTSPVSAGLIYNRTPDTIYVVKAVALRGPYKIGVTSDLTRRFRTICNQSPVDMELLCSMPGDKVLERRIHAHLLDAHLRCEWFRDCLAVRALVMSIRNGTFTADHLPAPKGVTSFVNGRPVDYRKVA